MELTATESESVAATAGALSDLRVAINHNWFTGYGGGERVVEALAGIFPQADSFCTGRMARILTLSAISMDEPEKSFVETASSAEPDWTLDYNGPTWWAPLFCF